MSDNKINKNIRYYLPNDPYYYEVDNLPIKDLIDNDDRLQIQLDQLKAQFDVVQGRSTFGELKPSVQTGNPGRVFVNPGNFLARVDSGSDRYTGLQETRDTSYLSDPTGENSVNTIDIESEAQDIAGGTARTALVRLYKNADGTIPSVAISEGTIEDYPMDANSIPPAYRLDLVYVKGTKAEDQDGGPETGTTLGVVRGAYFIKGSGGASGRSGSLLNRDDKTMIQEVTDVPPELIEAKVNPADGKPLFTTVPTPDLVNKSNSTMTPISMGNGTSIDKNDLSQYLASNEDSSMGCPIAYVLVPFNYIAGTPIPEVNLIDIRPFFRTNELTLPERQAIATADTPSIVNPFMTAKSVVKKFGSEVNRTASAPVIQTQINTITANIDTLQEQVNNIPIVGEQTVGTSVHWLDTPKAIFTNAGSTHPAPKPYNISNLPIPNPELVTNIIFSWVGLMNYPDGGGWEDGTGVLEMGAPGKLMFKAGAARSSGKQDEAGAGGGGQWCPTGTNSEGVNQFLYQITHSFPQGCYLWVVGYTTGVAIELS